MNAKSKEDLWQDVVKSAHALSIVLREVGIPVGAEAIVAMGIKQGPDLSVEVQAKGWQPVPAKALDN